jgi:hypothetical protein
MGSTQGVLSKMFGLRSAEGTQDGENGTVRSSMIGRRRQTVIGCSGAREGADCAVACIGERGGETERCEGKATAWKI